jgi:hypothetical protein
MNSWEEVGTHVTEELKRVSVDLKQLDTKMDNLSVQLACMEGKEKGIAAMIGGFSGLLCAVGAVWAL